jgi:hypothetical protein
MFAADIGANRTHLERKERSVRAAMNALADARFPRFERPLDRASVAPVAELGRRAPDKFVCAPAVRFDGSGIHLDDPAVPADEDRHVVHRLREKTVLAQDERAIGHTGDGEGGVWMSA